LPPTRLRESAPRCVSDYFSAKYTRLHNDANVLCMGGRVVGGGLPCELVEVILTTGFEGGRHQRRVDLITERTTGNLCIFAARFVCSDWPGASRADK
jgi:RpiB/LacA/LacB family sugar-phosphate isomerase